MRQLKFTTSKPHSIFGFGESSDPLVKLTGGYVSKSKDILYNKAYIHGEAETISGFDIPYFIDGDLSQLGEPLENQDILMVLPSGEYKCISTPVNYTGCTECYLLTLKK